MPRVAMGDRRLGAPMTVPRDATSAEIRLIDLEKRFGAVRAVDGVSLDVQRGRVLLAARTVRLRQDDHAADDRRLRAADAPAASCCAIATSRWTRRTSGPVNMVFQNYALFPHLDVGSNVGLRPQARTRSPKADIERRVGEALALVHLEGYERRKPNQLSGGQQQRVALARALVNRPTVLLLDEPLGALDLKLRRQLQLELKRIQHEVGITFVYVTHDQEEALTMSDRIAIMSAGTLEQLGTPEELYERPATRFVADFIGTTNLLRGTVEADGRVRLESGDVVRIAHDGIPTGQAIEVSLRPESIDLVPAEAEGALPGTVDQAAYLGTTMSYQVRTAGGLILSVLATKSGVRLPVGSAVAVTLVAVGRPRAGGRSGVDPMPCERGGAPMTHRYDGSSIDLERELTRYLLRERITRRTMLERIGKFGAAAALAPVIAACTSAGSSPSAAASAAIGRAVGLGRRCRRRRPAPTPVPSPEAELFIYNWTDYLGEGVIESFEEQYGVKVTQDFFSNTEEAYAKLGQRWRRLRHLVPDLGRHPGVHRQGRPADARQEPAAEHRQPGHGVVGSGLRPGQRAFRPVHVVDDRHRLRLDQGDRQPDEQQGPVGPAL